MLCFRGWCRRSRRWFCWRRSRRIREGEPRHGHAKQAANPHPSPTPDLFCPVHLISRRDAACRVFLYANRRCCMQQKTGETGPPLSSRNRNGAPISPVSIPVTEVYRPGRSSHPAPSSLADAPGTRHPARSSETLNPRNRPDCSPAACSLRESRRRDSVRDPPRTIPASRPAPPRPCQLECPCDRRDR